jgi:hypothetical protein
MTVRSVHSVLGSTPGTVLDTSQSAWRRDVLRMEHSPTSATGTGWDRTPWHATQRADQVIE